MGHVLFGGGITGIRGAVGGVVFSTTNGATAIKEKKKAVKHRTPGQMTVHTAITFVNWAWNNDLTQPNRQAWIDFGAQQITVSKAGVSHKLSGKAAFVKYAVPVWRNGNAIPVVPPATLHVGLPTILTIVAVHGVAGTLNLRCDTVDPIAGDMIQFYITPPQNPGKASWSKFLRLVPGTFTANAAHFVTFQYIDIFGHVPGVSGQIIGVTAQVINPVTGVKGATLKGSANW